MGSKRAMAFPSYSRSDLFNDTTSRSVATDPLALKRRGPAVRAELDRGAKSSNPLPAQQLHLR